MATGLTVSFIANLCVGLLGSVLRRRDPRHDDPVRRLRRPVGHQRLEPVDGRRPGDHRAVEVVSAQKARHLLWIFQRQPQSGRSHIVRLRGTRRGVRRMEMGIRRVGHCRSDGRGGDPALPARHARKQGTAAGGGALGRGRGRNGGGTGIGRRGPESRVRKPLHLDTRPGQRLHVCQPLRHKWLGRHLPPGGQRLPAGNGDPGHLRQRLSRHRRDGLFGMDVRQMVSTGAVTVSP